MLDVEREPRRVAAIVWFQLQIPKSPVEFESRPSANFACCRSLVAGAGWFLGHQATALRALLFGSNPTLSATHQ
jgi:hypothetical protein